MVFLVLIIYTAIGLFEIIPFIKKKEKGKMIVYSIFFLGAFAMSILLSMGVDIPSPTIIMEKIVYSITGQN